MRRIGAIYDLEPGLRLWDVDAGCGACGKRLAEVVEDVSGQWRAGQHVCIDCGTVAPASDKPRPVAMRPSWRAPGLHVAACQLCRYTSMPTTLDKAAEFAQAHLASSHGEQVAS
jgi:transcription initiation factor TFIIIB Brf1 subunit/transcription initiation factor TFIIB